MAADADAHPTGGLRFAFAGGVAANAEVRRVLSSLDAAHSFDFFAPPQVYCTDNAATIALAGAERLVSELDAVANMAEKKFSSHRMAYA